MRTDQQPADLELSQRIEQMIRGVVDPIFSEPLLELLVRIELVTPLLDARMSVRSQAIEPIEVD